VRIALINIGAFILTFCLMLYQLILRGSGAYGQILASFHAELMLFFLFLGALLVVLRGRLAYSVAAARRTLAYGGPLLPHAVSLWALNLSDRFLLSRFSGLEQVGYYTFAYTCGMAMQFIVASMQQVWGPVFFDVRRNDPNAKEILGSLATKWSLLLCGIAALGILFTPEIVRVIASKRYWVATPYIVPVLLGYLFNGLYTFPGLILQQMKKNLLLSLCTITAAAANIVSNLVFIPRFGPLAAAWNTAATFGLMALLYYFFGMKLNPIAIRRRPFAAGLAVVFAAVLLSRLSLTLPVEGGKALFAVLLLLGGYRYLGGFRGILGRFRG